MFVRKVAHSSRASIPPDKLCATCGRSFSWRKKWERCWGEVRYCSDGCRRVGAGGGVEGAALEGAILALLGERSGGATICPSEAARKVFPDTWRVEMEAARRAARRLVAQGRVVITQGGRTVDPDRAKGAIRLRLA